MSDRGRPGTAVRRGARFRSCQFDEIGQRVDIGFAAYGEHRRCRRDMTERFERGESIKMAGKQDRAQNERVLNEQDCRAIGRRPRCNLCADNRASSWPVLDNDRLSGLLCYRLADNPGKNVTSAARCIRNNNLDRPASDALRGHLWGDERQQGNETKTIPETGHFVSIGFEVAFFLPLILCQMR